MPSPKVDVVMGLFEAYLNIRKSNWSLDENDPMKSSLSYTQALKRDVCVDSLQKINLIKNNREWNAQLKDLIAKAEIELVNANKSRGFLGIWRLIGIVDRPLLLETLCAVISYANANLPGNRKLADEELTRFSKILDDLNQLNSHNQTNSTYHLYFYEQIIKVRNPASAPLIEESFEDFMRNVENGSRSLAITQKIITEKNTVENTPLPQLSSTAQLAAATSLALISNTDTKKDAEKDQLTTVSTTRYADALKRKPTVKQKQKKVKPVIDLAEDFTDTASFKM